MKRTIFPNTIKKIAKERGLTFAYDEQYHLYTVKDKTGLLLMEYAPITVQLIKRLNVWKHEFDLLKI